MVSQNLNNHMNSIDKLTNDLIQYHPRTILLFGSMAGHLAGDSSGRFPNDIDLLVICNNFIGIKLQDYGFEFEIHRCTVRRITEIAKSLRYDSKPTALAKLYLSNVVLKHARDIIAACLLLGPGYNDFGIEQIEINGSTDTRDYSIHQVLHGNSWWERLQQYAGHRKGPIKRFSDKIAGQYEFMIEEDP